MAEGISPSNGAISTPRVAGSYIRILRSDSTVALVPSVRGPRPIWRGTGGSNPSSSSGESGANWAAPGLSALEAFTIGDPERVWTVSGVLPAHSYLNISGLGSGIKPSRLGICTFGNVSALMTVILSIILPSASM